MIRSVCIITHEYPPDAPRTTLARTCEALARGLAELGIAVHVITRDPIANEGRLPRYQGVAVHRVRSFLSGSERGSDVDQMLWALAAAENFQKIDRDVDFDIVFAPDQHGESLKIETGPHTALVVQLFGSLPLLGAESEEEALNPVAAALELEAIRRADMVIAPSAELAQRANGLGCGRVQVLPPPFFSDKFIPTAPRTGNRGLELFFHGPLQRSTGPDLALEILAELKRRGRKAHLTLMGEDTGTAYRYRQTEMLTLMDQLGIDFSDVRFINELGSRGAAQHIATADAVVAPRSNGRLSYTLLEGLASGRPVVIAPEEPLGSWFLDDPAVHVLPGRDDAAAISSAADFLEQLDNLPRTCTPARARGLFDPARVASRYLELFESINRRPRLDRRLRQPLKKAPKLGVVIPCYNAVAYTMRCVESLLEHTTVPLRIVLVDNASIDSTASVITSIDDERVVPVLSPVNRGAAGGRNVGITYLDGDEDYVVFLDNDVEVLSEWWVPFVKVLEENPDVGLVGEMGMRATWTEQGRKAFEIEDEGVQPCEIVVGYSMFCRGSTVRRVGGFDERFGFLWHDDDDWTMRAARIGEGALRVPAERILHYEHRSSSTVDGVWDAPNVPSKLSEVNLAYLAKKHLSQELREHTPFLLLADAEEAVVDTSLLASWAGAFTRADEAALVLFGPGLDPVDYELRLAIAAQQAGMDIENGPRVIALLPPRVTEDEECTISDEVFAVLSKEAPKGNFLHLAWYKPGEATSRDLRVHAARMWAARPSSAPVLEGRLPA